jgi:glycosyltransferase involved in cell wall biosynthesis
MDTKVNAIGLTASKPNATVAVLIPCYNEALTVAKVVSDFKRVLPRADIYVYDNNSNDDTRMLAREAGAVIRRETLQGKGYVVRRMFADVEADIYVLVDGDDTYDAGAASDMVSMLTNEHLDMVTATRHAEEVGAYRRGHRLGNRIFTGTVRLIFGARIEDVLSGYRVFSRRFVKSFPALSTGFEIETEFTVHALELKMPIGELLTTYKPRPEGSTSKLHAIRDGIRIVRMIADLIRSERPLPFFSAIGGMLFVLGMALGIPVVTEFIHTGFVPRLPTAMLAVSFVLSAVFFVNSGLILDSVAHGRREIKRLAYLSLPALSPHTSEEFDDSRVRTGQ